MIVQDTCKFRDGTDYAEIWDPVTGDIYSNAEIINSHGYKNIPIRLNPFQSCFIVFSKPDKPANVSSSGENPFKEKTVVKILDGSWNVSFDTVWGGPSEIIFDQLTDWTQRKEDGIRFYSGIASYSKEFDFPEYSSVQNSENYLDLGRVKNIARVRLNGFDLGIVWTEPFQVNTMNALKKNKNRLEIEVSNLWVNRLIGDETHVWNGVENGKWPEWLISGKPKPTGRFTFTTHHYYRKGDPLTESGLIGPVRIMKTPER
jgi:hypothetical protein